jgi:hypothetical protein
MVSLESVWLLGCSLVGLSYILTEYLRRESWKYVTKERDEFPWVLSVLRDGSLIFGCVIVLGVIGHLVLNGGGV